MNSRTTRNWLWLVFLVLGLAHVKVVGGSSNDTKSPDLYEASVEELQSGLDGGHFTSVDLVKAYFARIAEVNHQGPKLNAIIETNPSALAEAKALDEEREAGGKRGILHGIPVLLKDNIATNASDGMNTTAGSFSLLKSIVPRDAGVVKRLRAAGAIILGKANLSEFAHFRGFSLGSGWTGRGNQTFSAYYPGGNPCGSSSGPGVAASIGLTAVALGTETDGSITCPSSNNNIVGIKPTVGLTSRAGVIPISSHQDSPGAMVRSVADAAAVLSIIVGPDPLDNYTSAQPSPLPDYLAALNKSALQGARIGVPRRGFFENGTIAGLNQTVDGLYEPVVQAFERAIETVRGLGAEVVDPADLSSIEDILVSSDELFVLEVDFKIELNEYYQGLLQNPTGVRSLEQLIAFNDAHPELEEPPGFEDQGILIMSQNTTGRNATYFASLANDYAMGRERGIDAVLKQYNLDALMLPAPGWTTTPSAIAGYPIITVPLGFYPNTTPPVPFLPLATGEEPSGPLAVYPAPGMPFGLSFFGTAWTEDVLLGFAYAYEQATKTRLRRRAFEGAVPRTQLGDVV